MLFIMVGEDETEGLQEREDDLANLDAELDAVEQGGTGQVASFDDSYGYNYEDSSELTDVDEQPGYDDSEDFTDFGDDDAYSVTGDDDEDDDNFDGDDEDFDNDAEDFDGDDDEPESKFGSMLRYGGDDDDDENEDDEEDAEDENKKKDGEEDEDGNSKNEDSGDGGNNQDKDNDSNNGKKKNIKKKQSRAEKKAEEDALLAKKLGVKKLWKKGEPITIETLRTYWGIFREHASSQIRDYMQKADAVVKQALNTLTQGPNLTLRLNEFITKIGDNTAGAIDSLLKLIQSPGLLQVYTTVSFVQFLFSFQAMELFLLACLSTMFSVILNWDIVQAILRLIFTKAMDFLKKKFKIKIP